MKISKKQHSNKTKTLSIIIAFLTLALLAYFIVAYATEASNPPTIDTRPTDSTLSKNKNDSSGKVVDTKETTGSDPSPSPAKSVNTDQTTVSMVITTAPNNSGVLSLRTLIQTISSTGTCTLTMTSANNPTYIKTAGVQGNPSASTCRGFDIPVSSLASGTWHVTINYQDGSTHATASRDIVINDL